MPNSKSSVDIIEGAVFEIAYPFSRTIFLDKDAGQSASWEPRTYEVLIYPDDSEMAADANGKCTLSVVSVHRPGKFPTRVFFTRKFTNPAGHTFGKNKLIIKTMGNFRRLISGYLYPYKIEDRGIDAAWERHNRDFPF
ncbi:MAG: hypothetical protein JKY66_00140 [Spongiibacteraceae bacterium]|nr:hypothetical protein [Spongiibacteraceae bacterium]